MRGVMPVAAPAHAAAIHGDGGHVPDKCADESVTALQPQSADAQYDPGSCLTEETGWSQTLLLAHDRLVRSTTLLPAKSCEAVHLQLCPPRRPAEMMRGSLPQLHWDQMACPTLTATHSQVSPLARHTHGCKAHWATCDGCKCHNPTPQSGETASSAGVVQTAKAQRRAFTLGSRGFPCGG